MTTPTPEIQPVDLAERLERGEPLQVLDVRPPSSAAGSRIDDDLLGPGGYVNLVGSQLMALARPEQAGLDRGRPIAVVCARGIASRNAADWLRRQGFDATSLAGGMSAWSLAAVPRRLAPPPGFDAFVQFDRLAKGSLAYLLARGGEALLVDPGRNLGALLRQAEALGTRIVGVADTHVHADYLSGSAALARHLGVPYHLHPADNASPYDGTPGRLEIAPLAEGSTIRVGDAEVRVEHNPGHTEGSVSFRAGDAVLSGDFVFVRSLGRPDLGGQGAAWSRSLWQSLERARREWPDDLRVFPAHYAGAAERNPDRSVGRAFGEIRRTNEPLGIGEAEAFFAWIEARRSSFPDAYRSMKLANVGLLPVDADSAELLELGRNECAVG